MPTAPYPRNWLLALILALSLGGLADAAYLTAKHYTGGPVPCSITGGCETVMNSAWASIAGVPTAGFGAVYYLATFFLTILYLDARRPWALTAVFVLSAIGLAVSLALVYVMAFRLHSFCQYCLLSDLITAVLFAGTLTAFLQRRRAGADRQNAARARNA